MNAHKAFNLLHGTWKISRTITNNSVMHGVAKFSQMNKDELFYREDGILSLPNNERTLNVYREYIYRYKKGEILIYSKEDHYSYTLLCSLEFLTTDSKSSGPVMAVANHICKADRYCASYSFDENNVNVEYQVNGPAKNYIITTLFERCNCLI